MGIIKSKIITGKGLLIQQYSSEINKTDLATYFLSLYQNPDYLTVTSIFSDFSQAQIQFTEEDLTQIAQFILAYAPKVNYVSNAIFVSAPLVTAYSFLYSEIMQEMPQYECRVFSTTTEAACFIGYRYSFLKEIIDTM